MTIDVDIHATTGRGERAFELHARFASAHDRVVLFGPSGAGKSLTLQAIAGLLRPTRGHIRVGGRTLYDSAAGIDVPARQRRLGFVFQDYALFPHLSVARNIAFGLTPAWSWRIGAALSRRVADVMGALDLQGLAERMPATLSGGQRQRVALARALVCEPDVLLLDEPFAALDVSLRERVRRELDALQGRFGVPLVLISHDPDDVRHFADTLVLYERGQVVSCGAGR